MLRSGTGLITCLGIKTIIRPKKNRKARYSITKTSLKDIYKIIKGFENLPYEGYVQKRSKKESTDSYFYLSRHLANFTMRLNSHVGYVRTQMTNTQKMNNSDISK